MSKKRNLRARLRPTQPAEPAPVVTHDLTHEQKAFMRQLEHQHRIRLEQEMAEAKELDRRAREIEKRVREQRRLRNEIEQHADYVRRIAPQLGFDPDRPVTEVPPLTDPNLQQVEFHTIREGRSYIRITYDPATNRYLYEIIEPQLSQTEREILEFIRDTLVRTLEGHRGRPGTDWGQFMNDAIETVIVDHSILVDEVSRQRILYYLLRDFFGFGEIDVLMHDPMIEDISCDGPNIPVYLFHRQYESIKTNLVFPHELTLDSFVIRLAQRSGKHISLADPLLDATLPDGSRLQASLGREVTTRGSSFTIRKFRSDPLTPPDLARIGTMSAHMAAYFWLLMENGKSVIFAGGTASGKTTTLNAVSLFIPPDKKIVSIEDTREINLRHENWIAGLTRTGFTGEYVGGKPAGTIDMYKLLEAALRQRPEYLIVGEVRGPEAMTLFQAMATGHATYSTLHADSVASAVYRLEHPPIKVPRIMLQTLDAISIQAQVRLGRRMARRTKEVVEIIGFDPKTGDLLTNAVFRWDPSGDRFTYLGKSYLFDRIRELNNLTLDQVETEWENRALVIEWLMQSNTRHIDAVSRIVNEYYRRPEELLRRIREDKLDPAELPEPRPNGAGTGPAPLVVEP
jgi:archaeal flagellar protein FlaI